jgi:iron complex transport system ATP-binding protein
MLEIRSVTFGYDKDKPAVENVSLNVAAGEFLGIIGPNGAGKTTLFKLISCVIKPQTGEIILNGKAACSYPRKEFAKIVAVLPQFIETFFPLTVEEFVSLGRFPYTSRFEPLSEFDRKSIEESMKVTETDHLKTRQLFQLSGGERQRALLAQALAQDPEILLLDEPTTHLDIAHQVEMLDLIKALNRDKGLTVVTVLHDLNLAGEYCENIVMMNGGKVELKGSPAQVLTYENIEKVYKTVVVVKSNPVSKRPHVFLVSKENLKSLNKGG